MTLVWFALIFIVGCVVYLFMMERQSKREKKERYEMINKMKDDAAGDPEKLRLIEIHEIEMVLTDKISEELLEILYEQDSDGLYKGAFKNNKPDINELTECLTEHGYQPERFDEKVNNMISTLAQNPELGFLLKHGVRKEAEIRYKDSETGSRHTISGLNG